MKSRDESLISIVVVRQMEESWMGGRSPSWTSWPPMTCMKPPTFPKTFLFWYSWGTLSDILFCWNIGPPGPGRELSSVAFFRSNLDLFKSLKLKLWFLPDTESREGSWMTYWLLPCCYGNARLFCANKKEPLVSQEDTSPPNQPQTPRDQNKTIHVFNYLIGSSPEKSMAIIQCS